MVTLGDLSSRFSQLGIVQQARTYMESLQKPLVEKPQNVVAVDPVATTDQLPKPVLVVTPQDGAKNASDAGALPPDVYINIPDQKTVTSTESGKSVTRIIQIPRVFSDCSFIYGLSACIRFETLWPRAINGFLRNPLFGSGYSTLTKAFRAEFTEAESTDNDFLRTLGEVGFLGAVAFYGMMGLFLYRSISLLSRQMEPLFFAVLSGLISATLALLFNGLYIDVFAASKVAFFFWAMMATGFRTLALVSKKSSL